MNESVAVRFDRENAFYRLQSTPFLQSRSEGNIR
jgi:hypothetical protein